MTRSSTAERVRRRRDALRRQGLRPFQIWIPDTRAPGFAEDCARQARLVADSYTEDDLAWLDDNLDDLLDLVDDQEHGGGPRSR